MNTNLPAISFTNMLDRYNKLSTTAKVGFGVTGCVIGAVTIFKCFEALSNLAAEITDEAKLIPNQTPGLVSYYIVERHYKNGGLKTLLKASAIFLGCVGGTGLVVVWPQIVCKSVRESSKDN